MRFLVVGAGATGGYFGGRLLEAGSDVTFLLRPPRAAQLAAIGLSIRSALGDAHLPPPPYRLATDLADPPAGRRDEAFDVVVLGCKARGLDAAMDALAPAVGPDTAILPLLNGMRHLDALDARFGRGRVLGGLCMISATLDAHGRVVHLNQGHTLLFGDRDDPSSGRTSAIAEAFGSARCDGRRSDAILQEMWEKWVLIAAVAGITCLLRGAVGDIIAAGASELATALLDECVAVAAAQGFAPRARPLDRARTILSTPGSTMTASMLRDVEHGAATEGDHILDDLLRRAAPGQATPLLALACAHLRTYEARRTREATATRETPTPPA